MQHKRLRKRRIWSGVSAIFLTLFGSIIALRGLALLLRRRCASARRSPPGGLAAGQILFGLIVLAGLKLTYDGWMRHNRRRA